MKTVSIDFQPFVGTVAMPDYLTLPQVLAFEDVNAQIREMRENNSAGALSISKVDALNVPLVLSIVTEWHIETLPVDLSLENFPMTPRLASAKMLAAIIREITKLYRGEIDIPNG